jgi:hypothetical protein
MRSRIAHRPFNYRWKFSFQNIYDYLLKKKKKLKNGKKSPGRAALCLGEKISCRRSPLALDLISSLPYMLPPCFFLPAPAPRALPLSLCAPCFSPSARQAIPDLARPWSQLSQSPFPLPAPHGVFPPCSSSSAPVSLLSRPGVPTRSLLGSLTLGRHCSCVRACLGSSSRSIPSKQCTAFIPVASIRPPCCLPARPWKSLRRPTSLPPWCSAWWFDMGLMLDSEGIIVSRYCGVPSCSTVPMTPSAISSPPWYNAAVRSGLQPAMAFAGPRRWSSPSSSGPSSPQHSCLPLARVSARVPVRRHHGALALRPLGFVHARVCRRTRPPLLDLVFALLVVVVNMVLVYAPLSCRTDCRPCWSSPCRTSKLRHCHSATHLHLAKFRAVVLLPRRHLHSRLAGSCRH